MRQVEVVDGGLHGPLVRNDTSGELEMLWLSASGYWLGLAFSHV